ncbi:MAG TPA: CocE/NonD family hydrolase [Eoetvoesiella sp.]
MSSIENFQTSEVRDGMHITWQIPIVMEDGVILRADLFRPIDSGPVPVIMSYGCYAKGQAFQDAYAPQWDSMVAEFPDITKGSTNNYQCWELTDPERWVPHGYAILRVDSRGAGWSEGTQDLWSAREVKDYHDCIEWAGTQSWCDGNVGLLGISYYAANQWLVAASQPRHLKAIIPWEGASDCYRELYFHGGIRCTFLDSWLPKQVAMQYGQGERSRRHPITDQPCAGPVTLSEDELRKQRIDKRAVVKAHPLLDDYYRPVITDFSKVQVPFLSSANWGGQGLHLRGNIEAFTQSSSDDKYLEIHGLEHWTHFYTPYGLDLQKRFFDRYLKGDASTWAQQQRVQLQVRHIDHFEQRGENEWPLARTQWTPWYLDGREQSMSEAPVQAASQKSYQVNTEGLTFRSAPFAESTEITGPLAARLYISSSTADADLFVIVRLFDPEGQEVTFRGAMDAHTPIAQGWLRASHRELDESLSTPWRPVYKHTRQLPLQPNEVVPLDIEIWPTSIVVPAGYQLAFTVKGSDYEYSGVIDAERNSRHRYPSKGCGPFLHGDSDDRSSPDLNGSVTVYTGGKYASQILLPIIP